LQLETAGPLIANRFLWTNHTGIALLVCNLRHDAGSCDFSVVPPVEAASRPGTDRTVFGNAQIVLEFVASGFSRKIEPAIAIQL